MTRPHVTLEEVEKLAAVVQDHVRPLRRAEYDQLVSLGTFQGEKIELICGALRVMSPIGPPHSSSIGKLTLLLVRVFGDRALVRVQCPFAASELSEPEPDFAIVPLGDWAEAHPTEAYLIIEVAESSLEFDRTVKLQMYAEAGCPEYWIVNLVDRSIETHSEPRDGSYAESRNYGPGESVPLRLFPDVAIRVDDALPPASPKLGGAG